MAQKFVSDDEFIRIWREFKSPTRVAEELKQSTRSVLHRRNTLQTRHNIELATLDQRLPANRILIPDKRIRVEADIVGPVVVFSDAHFYPGFDGPGYQALLAVIKQVKPVLIIANGDVLDAATMHSFSPLGWHQPPTIKQEMDAVREAMTGIQKAAKGAYLHRTIGNHDIRFDKRLAASVPEVRDVYGMSLKDHLPEWVESWSIFINQNTMVKHRIHSGIHSGWNNVLKSGVSTVTGHTHMLEIKPFGDYKGRRYGVSTGMLADPKSDAFYYLEDNPINWCQGFAVLTYDDEKRLLPPELCEVIEGKAYFRNKVVGENNV
jgi:hypothetical protein